MSKEIIPIEMLEQYHHGLLLSHITPLREEIANFKSGNAYIIELNKIKEEINPVLNNLATNYQTLNDIVLNNEQNNQSAHTDLYGHCDTLNNEAISLRNDLNSHANTINDNTRRIDSLAPWVQMLSDSVYDLQINEATHETAHNSQDLPCGTLTLAGGLKVNFGQLSASASAQAYVSQYTAFCDKFPNRCISIILTPLEVYSTNTHNTHYYPMDYYVYSYDTYGFTTRFESTEWQIMSMTCKMSYIAIGI